MPLALELVTLKEGKEVWEEREGLRKTNSQTDIPLN
jgi:hypothetical protein